MRSGWVLLAVLGDAEGLPHGRRRLYIVAFLANTRLPSFMLGGHRVDRVEAY